MIRAPPTPLYPPPHPPYTVFLVKMDTVRNAGTPSVTEMMSCMLGARLRRRRRILRSGMIIRNNQPLQYLPGIVRQVWENFLRGIYSRRWKRSESESIAQGEGGEAGSPHRFTISP